ncbi:MAG TPA: hypothetical protein VKE51_13820, partial [Vicinamibacterales bacterium]|nr:hypothetical protein [Vicinamibacterales bacterium]
MSRRARASLAATGALLAWFVSTPEGLSGRQAATTFPPVLAGYVTRDVKLTADEQAQLAQGKPVTKLLDADASKEVGIFGAVWIDAPIARYVAAVQDIENFEKGENFLVTKRVSSPPRPEDFAQISFTPDELKDLKSCKVGDCDLKLGEAGLTRIRNEVDWSKPTANADAERVIRTLALEYVNGYLEGGNARLAEYRDSNRPTFVAREFSSMIDRMPELTTYLPNLKRYLLDFPSMTLPMADSFVYWQNVKFGLKPTIRINHVTTVSQPTHTEVVSKMLYASHYFWTALELRVLIPDPARGDGFWFVNVNRSRSDGLSGFVGSLIRGKVRGEAQKGMEAALTSTKARMES